jgi:hypothetical protein
MTVAEIQGLPEAVVFGLLVAAVGLAVLLVVIVMIVRHGRRR